MALKFKRRDEMVLKLTQPGVVALFHALEMGSCATVALLYGWTIEHQDIREVE